MKKEIRNNLILKILNHGLVFLINVMIVRLIGGSEAGTIINHLYWLTSLSFLFSLGMDYAVISSISANPDSYRFWHSIFCISSITYIPLSFLFFIVMNMLGFNQHHALWFSIFFVTGQTMLILFQGLLSAVKRFLVQNFVLIFFNSILLIILVSFYFNPELKINQDDIFSLITFNMLLQGLSLSIVSFTSKKSKISNIDSSFFKLQFRHGIKIMFTTLVFYFFIRSDQFFAQKFTNPVDFGNYVQCGKIGQYFLLFASMISSMLLPFISVTSASPEQSTWYSILKPYIWLMSLTALGIGISGSFIFPFFFGSEFEEMHQIMNILLPGYLALAMLTFLNAFYIGKGKLKRMILGDCLGLVILLLMNMMLSKNGNVVTIAWISTSCYVGLFFFMLYGVKKRLDL